ncbi:MAG TPA: neutral zinc metallopeptidase [Kofleriaceae bacterium]
MRWDRDHQSSDIEDRRSEGGAGLGGGGLGIGGGSSLPLGSLLAVAGRFGWRGILAAFVIFGALTYGGNFCGHSAQQITVPSQRDTQTSSDELEHFVGFVLDDVQKTWRERIPNYQDAKLVLFRNAIQSACGTATSAVGPFYCQLDHKVYIDLAFYEELRKKFGAPGDFAQAYVIAHELGHHVQNLRGLFGRGEASSVPIELQADCLAGAWGKSADSRGLLEGGDLQEALTAASAIGDDTLQRKSQGYVRPETFTHGTSAQRTASFRKGYDGGAAACGI